MGTISILVSLVGKVKDRSYNVKFSVSDEGPGMTDHQVSQLFRPFTQLNAHELQRGGGSGVGLSICKKIIEQHGGTVEVVSALGRGSTFSFIVPLAISPQDTSANMVDDVLPIKINNGNPYPRRQSVRDSSYLSIEEKSLFTMRRPSLTRSSTKTLSSNDSCSSKASSSKRTALVADGELI